MSLLWLLGCPKHVPGPAPASGPEPLWETRVGNTTYRSTIHVLGDRVVLGTNGLTREGDALDGLYVLDGKDGRVRTHVHPPGGDETDVNGIAATADAYVFGTDQGRVYKVAHDGAVLWIAELPGDVEGAPAMADLDRDGVPDAVVGVEEGPVVALSGATGAVLWSVPSDVGEYDQVGFTASVGLADASGDGLPDALVPGRDGAFRVIDGGSGFVLWSDVGHSGRHGAPIVVNGRLVYTQSYSTVTFSDLRGTMRTDYELHHEDGGIEGLFSAVGWNPVRQCALVGTAWWQASESMRCVAPDGPVWSWTESTGNITSGAVVGDVDGRPGPEIVFGTESGKLVAVTPDGETVWTIEVGGPIECPPTLGDLDGNGRIDVVVASNDAYVRAYATAGTEPPIIGYYRGDPMNTGVLQIPEPSTSQTTPASDDASGAPTATSP